MQCRAGGRKQKWSGQRRGAWPECCSASSMAEAHRGDLIQPKATPWDWSFYILGPTARCTERSFGVRATRCRFFASQLAGGQIALKVGRRVNLI